MHAGFLRAHITFTAMGVPLIERKLAASTKLEATYHQAGNVLTVTSRAPAYRLHPTLLGRLGDPPLPKTFHLYMSR